MQNDNTVQQVNFTCNTNGSGYWSSIAKAVAITQLVLCIYDNSNYADLHVHFDDSWNVDADGLIYTDEQFMQQLKNELTALGYDVSDISYSEQGMQGEDFVSLDTGSAFIASWVAKHS